MGELCPPRPERGNSNAPFSRPSGLQATTLAAPTPGRRLADRPGVVLVLVAASRARRHARRHVSQQSAAGVDDISAGVVVVLRRPRRDAESRLCRCPDGRVAMVVTKAPSEPWPLVRSTLEPMLAQEFATPRVYDVWLADEDPSSETRAWCAEHGVNVSCRARESPVITTPRGRAARSAKRATWPTSTR